MLSLHTQTENLANLLHRRRAQRVQHIDRQQAYRSLVAAILEAPLSSVSDVPAYQPAFAREATSLAPRISRAA